MASATTSIKLKCLEGQVSLERLSYSVPAHLTEERAVIFFPKVSAAALCCLLSLLSKAWCLPMRQLWQHQQEQPEHHWRMDLAGTAAGSNVYSAIQESSFSFLFFSLRLLLLHQEDDLEAPYLFSIFCICRLSDVKLARRSVTSSTCQKNTAGC